MAKKQVVTKAALVDFTDNLSQIAADAVEIKEVVQKVGVETGFELAQAIFNISAAIRDLSQLATSLGRAQLNDLSEARIRETIRSES